MLRHEILNAKCGNIGHWTLIMILGYYKW
jgi:hypothetical protein